MIRATLPWRNVGLDLVSVVPDRLRAEVARRRYQVKTLTTERELDEHLDRAAALFAENDDAARRFLGSFEYQAPAMPADPFSAAYALAQWELYRQIARRDHYETSNEHSDIDVTSCVQRPYPYTTGSATQVADQLAAWSFIIRRLQPRPGTRVVEFGPGWGNLTLQLAMAGVDITAVEVDGTFAELLRQRAAANTHLSVVEADMLTFSSGQPFDAALFFESFHHCSDHLALLEQLHGYVKPDGAVLFAGEPVGSLRYPWGLRLDGMSLFSTRRYGWLELGFSTPYFAAALHRTGWQARRYRSRSMTPLADVIVARSAR